mmetsp:Transcript_1727/g.2416  ORF Transcript_1727/g.2416 Transcript_1727/m.2416 type:complete len:154 (+) Transcript_1727:2160-2621(+)
MIHLSKIEINNMFLQLFIINRSGGLVFTKNLSSLSPTLSTNDCLRLGSTFHGLHAIATQIAPIVSSGIEKMETDTFVLQCLQTLTGVKFVITATPGTTEINELLHAIYEIYADYVLKNPFYEIEMPIRCDLFTKHLDRIVMKLSSVQGRRKQP